MFLVRKRRTVIIFYCMHSLHFITFPQGCVGALRSNINNAKNQISIKHKFVKYPHCTPIAPSRRTKLWKDAATVRAIGVPNIGQPPPGEVGGAKLKRPFHRTP